MGDGERLVGCGAMFKGMQGHIWKAMILEERGGSTASSYVFVLPVWDWMRLIVGCSGHGDMPWGGLGILKPMPHLRNWGLQASHLLVKHGGIIPARIAARVRSLCRGSGRRRAHAAGARGSSRHRRRSRVRGGVDASG